MAFNIVLSCCVQNVNDNVCLDLGGGWKHLAVPWHAPPLPHGPSQQGGRGCWSPCLSGTVMLLQVSWAIWGMPWETASPKVVIQMISSGIIIQAYYPHATLKQSFVKLVGFFFHKTDIKILRLVCCSYTVDVLKFCWNIFLQYVIKSSTDVKMFVNEDKTIWKKL